MSAPAIDKRSSSVAGVVPLFDTSERPIYAVDADRRVVYANAALIAWLGLERNRVLGRYVEYHSEPNSTDSKAREPVGPLTELCPPPIALAGTQCAGTVASLGRDGRLVHRRAVFVPLASVGSERAGVLVLLSSVDLSPQELSETISTDPTPDELHRAIRRFRHSQSETYTVESLVGISSGIQKVRAQVAAAAAGTANVLIRGPRGSGRAHVARSIHYRRTGGNSDCKLVSLDCAVATEDMLRRTVDSAIKSNGGKPSTLLLLDLEQLAPALEPQLLMAIIDPIRSARVTATQTTPVRSPKSRSNDPDTVGHDPEKRLLDAVSTITIEMPSLTNRLDDLPLLAQHFLEACNKNNAKQAGSVRGDALDLFALYCWPGELDELREVIAAAHAASATPEITPADLPAAIQHAAKTAATPRRKPPEKIVLDDLLAAIEREAIVQAVAQAAGNKTAAAELLGMTRPRLYRRMVQLGLAGDSPIEFQEDTSQ
jgi:transcriptional regulator with PAS, ATPase and Fis domain